MIDYNWLPITSNYWPVIDYSALSIYICICICTPNRANLHICPKRIEAVAAANVTRFECEEPKPANRGPVAAHGHGAARVRHGHPGCLQRQLSNYQLHYQLLKTKTTKTCQIKCRQENNRSQCSVVNLLLLLISFLNVYSHLSIKSL